MKVGINLINFGPTATPDVLAGWANMAESLGYHSLLTSDHVAVTPDVSERYAAPFYEPISMLGWLAGVTERIAIGLTVMILPYRNPLESARALANIDQLSSGRLICGVGIGWAEQEFAALDVAFRRRGAITDEYLDVMTRHWTQDELTFAGEFVSCEGVDTAPLPVQRPHPPIWVGGSSEAALRRTVRFGQAWHPIRLRSSWLQEKGIPRLRAEAESQGKPMPELCPRVMFRVTQRPLADEDRFLGEGTIDQIHQDLHELETLGCSHVILDSFNTFEQDVSQTEEYQQAWDHYATFAADVIDLAKEAVR